MTLRLLASLTLTLTGLAQDDHLRFEGASAELTALLTDASREPTARPATGFAAAMHLLGALRRGDHAASRRALAGLRTLAQTEAPRAEAAPWNLIAHYWYLRTTGDHATIAAEQAALADRATRLLQGDSPPTFVEASLHVHALFCLGELLDAIAGPANETIGPGREWTARAIDLQLAVERRAWQPGQGHFRNRLTDGGLSLPEHKDPQLLLPAAAGLLIATGDRALRHLRSVLHDPRRSADAPLGRQGNAAALLLSTAVQVDDEGMRIRWWQALMRAETTEPAGLRLDAACFALTGVRIATGAALDACLRCRPWLPPGFERLQLQNVHAHGSYFDLTMSRRREAGQPVLHVELRLDPRRGGPLPIVVAGESVQYVTELFAGKPFLVSLPLPEPEAEDHADRGRR